MGSRTPKKKQDFRLEEVDDELLLYHPVRTTALYLNNTAALIWKLCDGRRSSVEIGALLADAFPAGAHTIQDEVESTLDELARLAAVEFV